MSGERDNRRELPAVGARGSGAAAVALLATALVCGAAAGAVAADTPAPLPSAGVTAEPAPELPVMPPLLDLSRTSCTKASSRQVTAMPWAQLSLELTRAHQLTTGAGVRVAVIDTGVENNVSALSGRVTGVGAGATDDCVGHGSFIAGTIAAEPAAGSAFSGVAPGARILAVRGTDSTGAPDQARVAAGIRSATDAGAKVIAVSLSFSSASDALESALDHAADRDVLVVAAALPDGLTASAFGGEDPPSTLEYWPAADPRVLSVVDQDITGARPSGSLEPARADLAAPGQGITGIGPRGKGNFLANGPSVAAAFVAGAAALVRSYDPDLSAAEVAARLKAGAYPARVPQLNPYGALAAVAPSAGPSTRPRVSDAIHLNPVVEDTAPGRRAYTVLGMSAAGAGVLAAGALLTRRNRRNRAAAQD
ncbi:S8 family serine peptidase [Streptomyces sp. NPDC088387]|uniref:S8 family serine peptidase n=1 Tax=Streptomyces sp. NPDC088387 TaxID=3365859 RepID=UPI0038093A81